MDIDIEKKITIITCMHAEQYRQSEIANDQRFKDEVRDEAKEMGRRINVALEEVNKL